WGVTLSLREAATNWTLTSVAVLLAKGIWTPCSISALMLFKVAILGAEMVRDFPSLSRASRATFKLNDPVLLKRLKPSTLSGVLARPSRYETSPRFGNSGPIALWGFVVLAGF